MALRKQRKLKQAVVLRGGNAVQSRVPYRRISVELPEPLWARLKNVGLKQQTAIGNLIIKACRDAFGDATEAEILALYNEMAGIANVEQTPDPEVAPNEARTEVRPKVAAPSPYNPFESYTVTALATPMPMPAQPQPQPDVASLPVTKQHKARARKTKQIPANAPESAWEEVRCSQETVDLTRKIFEV